MSASTMSHIPRQLALALEHTESYAREDFLAGPCNEAALTLIDSWPDWPANAVALIGPEGSGKTHLATIWAAAAGARVVSAHALDETGLRSALATGALVIEDAAATSGAHGAGHLAYRHPRCHLATAGNAARDPSGAGRCDAACRHRQACC